MSADCTEDILQTRLPVGVGMWSAVSRAAIAEKGRPAALSLRIRSTTGIDRLLRLPRCTPSKRLWAMPPSFAQRSSVFEFGEQCCDVNAGAAHRGAGVDAAVDRHEGPALVDAELHQSATS